MKANKNFRMEDEAVSPVIGVILMVAITVVLAAVVFVLVSDLGDTKDSAPPISFDKTGNELRVISADEEANWQDIEVSHTGCTSVTLSGSQSATFGTSGDTGNDGAVVAGDKLTVVSGGGCEITMRHVATNQLYDTWSFA